MKRLMAMLLTGCLIFQPVSGAGAAVWGADFSSGAEEAVPIPEEAGSSAGAGVGLDADIFSSDMGNAPSDAPSETLPDEGIPEESPDQGNTGTDDHAAIGELVPDEEPGEDGGAVFDTGDEGEVFSSEETEPLLTQETAGDFSGTALLEVKISTSLPFEYLKKNDIPITISVTGPASVPTETVLMDKNEEYISKDFELPAGKEAAEYLLRISAAKFAVYEQKIAVRASHSYKIDVTTSKVLTGKDDQGVKRGWMRLGDANGDGVIAKEDLDAIVAAIHSGVYDDKANFAMAAKDGDAEKIDLADLQYAVQSIGEDWPATPTELYIPQAETVKADEKTLIEGSVEDVLKGESSVSLAPVGGGEISSENPVGISFDLAEENEKDPANMPHLGGMTIETPTSLDAKGNRISDISAGEISYTYYDENGDEHTGSIRIEDSVPGTEQAISTVSAAEDGEPLFGDDISDVEAAGDGEAEEIFGDDSTDDISVIEEDPAEDIQIPEEDPADDIQIVGEEQAPEEEPLQAPAEDAGSEEDPIVQFIASALLPGVTVYAADLDGEPKSPTLKMEADGTLVLDFGRQVAVKRVTLKITGTKKNAALAEIGSVEFVNNMENRIPAPKLNIPAFITEKTIVDNEEMTVSWSVETNVTGYELYVKGPVKKSATEEEEIIRVKGNEHLIVKINDKPIKNFAEYTFKVRSVNGNWSSPWSAEYKVVPEPKAVPAAVDNLSADGKLRIITASWKDMKDASGYMLYYREMTQDDIGKSDEQLKADIPNTPFIPVVPGFTEVSGDKETGGEGMLTTNKFTIENLKDKTIYLLYVKGWNSKGWGPPSLIAKAETSSGDLPHLPKYNWINVSVEQGQVSEHIVSAIHGDHGKASMVGSRLDEEKTSQGGTGIANSYWAYGVVDNDYDSYWMKNDWDDGVSYPVNNFSKGITVAFDKEYEMSYLTFTSTNLDGIPGKARIYYWNGDKSVRYETTAEVTKMLDETKHPYFLVKFSRKISANQILMCLERSSGTVLKVGEIHFHRADGLEDEVYGLYDDEMHSVLKKDVTEEKIAEIEAKVNTRDEVSGEYHPLYDYFMLELENARNLLKFEGSETVAIDNRITASKDGHVSFGGLNGWQPMGKTVYAGEKLIVYVSHNFKKIGSTSDLQVVFTQYHAESNKLSASYTMKVGRNEITVPYIANTTYENGGQVYINYKGNNAEDKYGVRISGGVDIPKLNIYKKTGDEKKAAIEAYVKELEAYVGTISAKHDQFHKQADRASVNYDYDEKLCVLNATDIMMEHMMYSIPATQAWAGIKDASDKAAALETALDAMEQTMVLFYQHKGLTNMEGNTKKGNNAIPSRHLNIRYMRMFAGAFMYASGDHIGIEFPETKMATGAASWNSFGWGIAHEIGHDINEGKYAIAEITNNYFAQLLTRKTSGLRFKFEDVYKKVTSGEIGRSSNGAVQLALYWQLHLAFDNYTDGDGDRTIFSTYDDMFNNLFFARVDTYIRHPDIISKKLKVTRGGKEYDLLSLNDGVDQNLMRYACAAANENILPFFERWGMVPDEDTRNYAALYGAPTQKALYYVNEDARNYRVAHPDGENLIGKDVVNAAVSAEGQYATVTIHTTADPNLVLGYEIIRGTYTDGEMSREVVGFVEANGQSATTYTDTISVMNNRVMYYEVKPVDKYLNYANSASAGSVKIKTGGALSKEGWTVTTNNLTSAQDVDIELDDDDPDRGYNVQITGDSVEKKLHTIERIIDSDRETIYQGTAGTGASIVIDMKTMKEVTSLIYKGSPLSSVVISAGVPDAAQPDGYRWTVVKSGYSCTGDDTIWFDSVLPEYKDSWIGTYDAQVIGIAVPEGNISISEIEVCGPSGDDLEFRTSQETEVPAIGILESEYRYGNGEKDVIPAESLLFIGKYQGNPAYNVVVLYDQDGNVIGADAEGTEVNSEQVILAKVPDKGNLGETSDGSWVYYVRPEYVEKMNLSGISRVRGELYRVDNALTMKGERVVSDTVFLNMPAELPRITLTGGSIPGAN